MIVIFDESSHTYEIDGKPALSVSDILKPLAAHTYAKVDEATLRAAAERGRRIHELCELDDYDALPDAIEHEALPYLQAYRDFKRDFQIKEWMAIEKILANEELMLCGTVDRIGEIDGRVAFVDLKTTSSIDKKRLAVQLTAYAMIVGYDESLLANLYGVQLKKDGIYRVVPVESAYDEYRACLMIAKYLWKEGK